MAWKWLAVALLLLAGVLVPFLFLDAPLAAVSERLIGGDFPAPVFFVIVVALLALDIVLPIPSSIVSTAAGAVLGFWGGVAAVWIGMMVGCVVGYTVGALAPRMAPRFIDEASMRRARRAFDRHGAWALAACRAVPVLAEASVVLAGLIRSHRPGFFGICAIANLAIAAAYAAVGTLALQTGGFLLAFAGATLLPGLALLLVRRQPGGTETV